MELYKNKDFRVSTIFSIDDDKPISYGLQIEKRLDDNEYTIIVYVRLTIFKELEINDIPDLNELGIVTTRREKYVVTDHDKRLYKDAEHYAINLIMYTNRGN